MACYWLEDDVNHIEDVRCYSDTFVTIPQEVKADIISKTLGGSKESAMKILDELFKNINPQANPIFVKAAVTSAFYELLGLVFKTDQCNGGFAEIGIQYISNMDQVSNLVELKQLTKNAFAAVCDRLFEVRKRSSVEVYKRAMNYVNENYNKDITLGDIARYVHVSPHHLSRGFKGYSGMNLSQYIAEKRIDKAKRLLLTTDANVGEIGKKVGYGDPNYFGRVFKNFVGLSPSKFRSDLGR